jgi:hypothetical protein
MRRILAGALASVALLIAAPAQAAPTGSLSPLSVIPNPTGSYQFTTVTGSLSATTIEADLPPAPLPLPPNYLGGSWRVVITTQNTNSASCWLTAYSSDTKFTSEVLTGARTYDAPFSLVYNAYTQQRLCLYVEYLSASVRVGAVCNDGTISTATGQGACSYHDGVRYWREGQVSVSSSLVAEQIIPSTPSPVGVIPIPVRTPVPPTPTPVEPQQPTLSKGTAIAQARKALKCYRSYRYGNHRVITAYSQPTAVQRVVRASWRYHGKRYRKTVVVSQVDMKYSITIH